MFARSSWMGRLLLFLLLALPSVVFAQDTEEEAPEEEVSGLEIIDLGVTDGYIRKPLPLRLRRSIAYTWVTRGLLFTSELALGVVWAVGGEGQLMYFYLWPSFAATTALLSVSQARRGLREHWGEPARPYWRTAGILTLCIGTATSVYRYRTGTTSPEVAVAELALAQLLGTLMIQLQGWRYRRDIKGRSWPPWLDLIDKEKQAKRVWVPVLAPTKGGAIVGTALAF